MNGDGGDADLFEGRGEFRSGLCGGVPAESHLDCHGNPHGADQLLNHPHGIVRTAHQTGSAAGSVDLGHGATHVDINSLIPLFLQPHGCADQIFGATAEDLNGQRAVFRGCGHQFA